jgi:hypothetical protein
MAWVCINFFFLKWTVDHKKMGWKRSCWEDTKKKIINHHQTVKRRSEVDVRNRFPNDHVLKIWRVPIKVYIMAKWKQKNIAWTSVVKYSPWSKLVGKIETFLVIIRSRFTKYTAAVSSQMSQRWCMRNTQTSNIFSMSSNPCIQFPISNLIVSWPRNDAIVSVIMW